jgi:hypothetical protein
MFAGEKGEKRSMGQCSAGGGQIAAVSPATKLGTGRQKTTRHWKLRTRHRGQKRGNLSEALFLEIIPNLPVDYESNESTSHTFFLSIFVRYRIVCFYLFLDG